MTGYVGLWTGLWSCLKKPTARYLGSDGAAAMALRAACSGILNKDNTRPGFYAYPLVASVR